MATDYISREEAIEALVNLTAYNSSADIKSLVESKYYYQGEWIGGVKDALEEIENIPAADVVERKRGEWIYSELDNFRKYSVICPFCRTEYTDNYDGYVDVGDFNFCPNCGARMDGEIQ